MVDHAGPASYTTGGETISPFPYGMTGIDFINLPNPAVSVSQNYQVVLVWPTGQNGLSLSSIKMMWIVLSTGLEVAASTNLSAERVRMQVIGGLR